MKKIIILGLLLMSIGLLNACNNGNDNPTEDDTEPPVITGVEDRTISVGSFVTDWLVGVSATDNVDGDLTSEIVLDTSALDVYSEGTYDVIYSVTDSSGNEASETITVTVTSDVQSSVPIIEGVTDFIIDVNDTSIDFLANVTATDSLDGDLTSEITLDDSFLDYSVEGEYTITFSVTNTLDETTVEEATVTVASILMQIPNGDFETGDLTGWTVRSGNAFSEDVITDESTFWTDILFKHQGTFHMRGILNEEYAVGQMQSDVFKIAGEGIITMQLGAAKDITSTYVQIINANTLEVLAEVSNHKFDYIDGDQPYNYAENYADYMVDLSEHIGEYAYILIVDEDSDEDDFSFMNIDNIVTYYEEYNVTKTELLNPSFTSAANWQATGDLSGYTWNVDNTFSTNGDLSVTGTLHSTPFVLEDTIISFLVQGTKNTSVRLVHTENDTILREVSGATFSDDMYRYIFDVSEYMNEIVKIVITDDSLDGAIQVDDIIVSSEDINSLDTLPTFISNGGFETGDFTGWYQKHGTAFTDDVITSMNQFWLDIPDHTDNFYHSGEYHLHGLLAGEDAYGSLVSNYFVVNENGYVSLLLGAAKDTETVFVDIKDASTNQVLARVTNEAFDFVDFDTAYSFSNHYQRYYVDLTAYEGRVVYIEIIDLDRDPSDFSYINIDDIKADYSTNITIPEAFMFSTTTRSIKWSNYIEVFAVDQVEIDDSNVDLSAAGVYDLDVFVTLYDATVEHHTIEVTVTDNEPPTISGTNDILVLKGEDKAAYDFIGDVQAYDSLGNSVTVTMNQAEFDAIDFNTVGTYPLSYEATGSNGVTGYSTITIEVINPSNSIVNGNFETGDLTGWTVISGESFSINGVTDNQTYWAEQVPFYNEGTYHFYGKLSDDLESSIGVLQSSYFILSESSSGYVSFMLGAGNGNQRVEVVNAFTDELIATQLNTFMNDNQYVRYYLDLSSYKGEVLYFLVIDENDNATEEGFAYINIDDFFTEYETVPTLDISLPATITVSKGTSFNPLNYVDQANTYAIDGMTYTIHNSYDLDTIGTYEISIDVSYQGLVKNFNVSLEVEASPYQITNGNFETGDLTGWTTTGTAFCESVVTDTATFWNGPFNHEGTYHLRGYECGEAETGTLTSSQFEVGGSGYISMMLGGMADPTTTYISIIDAETDTELLRVTNTEFSDPNQSENYATYYVDLSSYIGDTLYLVVVDENSNPNGFAFVNIDNIITYYETDPTAGGE